MHVGAVNLSTATTDERLWEHVRPVQHSCSKAPTYLQGSGIDSEVELPVQLHPLPHLDLSTGAERLTWEVKGQEALSATAEKYGSASKINRFRQFQRQICRSMKSVVCRLISHTPRSLHPSHMRTKCVGSPEEHSFVNVTALSNCIWHRTSNNEPEISSFERQNSGSALQL